MKKIFTPEVKEQIIKMYASGIKARDITAQTGLNISGVKTVIARAKKNDTVLGSVHEQHHAPQQAINWWGKQTPKFRRDAAKWLDVLTVEEMWEYCSNPTKSLKTTLYGEDSRDC